MFDSTPVLGAIVAYCLDTGPNKRSYRPAIITRVWSPGSVSSAVQLQVFTDGSNDGLDNVEWRTSRVHGEGEGQWLWPGEVPDLVAA